MQNAMNISKSQVCLRRSFQIWVVGGIQQIQTKSQAVISQRTKMFSKSTGENTKRICNIM